MLLNTINNTKKPTKNFAIQHLKYILLKLNNTNDRGSNPTQSNTLNISQIKNIKSQQKK